MNPFSVISTILIAIGVAIMAISFVRARHILSLLDELPQAKRWWQLQALILFFLISYLASIPIIFTSSARVLLLVMGVIFLAGAAFVNLVLIITQGTIKMLLDAKQELIEARDEALEGARLKTTLLANVTHELRTPIQSLLGYLQMLQKGVYGFVSADQERILGRMVVNVNRLMRQINNLLVQSSIEMGQEIALEIQPFTPRELLVAVEETLIPLAVQKEIVVRPHIGHGVPEQLHGDLERLKDIALNLASNAIKFTETGVVHVRIFLTRDGFWALQVADTGSGIAEEHQRSVFKPFQRANNIITQTTEGMGLGLALVQQWTELLGGELSLTSVDGQGSIFTVEFPLQEAAEKSKENGRTEAASIAG